MLLSPVKQLLNSHKGDKRHWWTFYRLLFQIQDYNLTFSLSLSVFLLLSHSFSQWMCVQMECVPCTQMAFCLIIPHPPPCRHTLCRLSLTHTLTDITAKHLCPPFRQCVLLWFMSVRLTFQRNKKEVQLKWLDVQTTSMVQLWGLNCSCSMLQSACAHTEVFSWILWDVCLWLIISISGCFRISFSFFDMSLSFSAYFSQVSSLR